MQKSSWKRHSEEVQTKSSPKVKGKHHQWTHALKSMEETAPIPRTNGTCCPFKLYQSALITTNCGFNCFQNLKDFLFVSKEGAQSHSNLSIYPSLLLHCFYNENSFLKLTFLKLEGLTINLQSFSKLSSHNAPPILVCIINTGTINSGIV